MIEWGEGKTKLRKRGKKRVGMDEGGGRSMGDR